MKYLKLFEAFESEILSATLKFLSQKGKKDFLKKLENIARTIDFPMSKYSDEYFQYLPYDKALELNFNRLTDEDCDAESVDVFGDAGIKGEFCKEGKIKRKWGRGTRIVNCPTCRGTGVKPKSIENPKIKWIKFWFDKDGNYITMSGVDGVIRKKGVDLGGYDLGEELNLSDIQRLPTGVKVGIKLASDGELVHATSYRSGLGNVYMIQNYHNGASPDEYGWRQYGEYAWIIRGQDAYYGAAYKLIPKETKEEIINPFDWNGTIEDHRMYITNQNLENKIKRAHFAIVLDFLELGKSEFKKVSDIKSGRKEERTGAVALMSDAEIKTLNINRYLDEISKRVELDPELKNIKSSFMKVIGGRKVLAKTLKGDSHGIRVFINALFKFIKAPEQYYKENLEDVVTRSIRENNKYSNQFIICIENAIKSFKALGNEEALEFVKKLNKVFDDSFQKINSEEITSFEDIELLYEKIYTMYHHIQNTPKYRSLLSVISNLVSYGYQPNYFIRSINNYDISKLNTELDDFIKSLQSRGWLNK